MRHSGRIFKGVPNFGFVGSSGTFVSAPFNPITLSGVLGAYDPADAANYTVDTGKVSVLTDLSGNGNHFVQTSAAVRPVIAAGAAPSGADMLDCASAHMVTSGAPFNFSNVDPFTYALVTKDVTNLRAIFSNIYAVGVNPGIALYSDTNLGIQMVNTDGVNQIQLKGDSNVSIGSATAIYVITYDGSSTAAGVKMYKNGVESGSYSVISDTLSASCASGQPQNLGQHGYGFGFDGKFGCVFVYNRVLTAQERADLNDYLTERWL